MNEIWKRTRIGLVMVTVFALLSVSLAGALVPAKPGGGGGKPPGEEPPADPAIAFFLGNNRKPDKLMVMNADGSNQAVIYEEHFSTTGVSWSPDGGSLVWGGYTYVPYVPGYDYGVWRIDVNVVDGNPQGSNLQRLVSSEYWISGAAWSPLGDEIAYTVHTTDDIFRVDAVPATGGTPYTVFAPEGYGLLDPPAWSSDGTRFAVIGGELSAGYEGMSIIIVDRATGTITHELLTGQHAFKELSWARQGVDTLVFGDGNEDMIYTVDIETEMAEPVVPGFEPCWSPDNSKIVYKRYQSRTKYPISTYEFSTGEITTIAGGGAQPDWRRF
jgi:Tol biopolymer transport system component